MCLLDQSFNVGNVSTEELTTIDADPRPIPPPYRSTFLPPTMACTFGARLSDKIEERKEERWADSWIGRYDGKKWRHRTKRILGAVTLSAMLLLFFLTSFGMASFAIGEAIDVVKDCLLDEE